MSENLTIEKLREMASFQSARSSTESVIIPQLASQLLATMRREEKLREALAEEITCVCEGAVGKPVFIAHHRYCRNNPHAYEYPDAGQ